MAKGFSEYGDSLFDDSIEQFLIKWLPLNFASLSPYFDLFAFGITMLVTGIFSNVLIES